MLFLVVLLNSCSTVRLVDTWENPHIGNYKPAKVLIVGMTSNKDIRMLYERKIKEEYMLRGIDAVMSLTILEESFVTSEKTMAELKNIEDELVRLNFDSVLFSKINKIEDKVSFSSAYRNIENMYQNFSDDYYKNQPVHNVEYYPEEYKVYHTETTLYCICPTNDRKLIWKGYIDLVRPSSLEDNVDKYVKLVLSAMEKEKLIPKQ